MVDTVKHVSDFGDINEALRLIYDRMPQLAKDINGNVTGLVGAGGETIPVGFTALSNMAGDKACAASGASLREAAPAEATAYRVTNASAYGVYVVSGDSTVEASSANGTLVAAGLTQMFMLGASDTHVAYASADSAQTPTFNLAWGN